MDAYNFMLKILSTSVSFLDNERLVTPLTGACAALAVLSLILILIVVILVIVVCAQCKKVKALLNG